MTRTASHLAFIPELIRIICEQCQDKHTLAILARTCKSFSNPALDVLWYRPPSIYPLLNCLPPDALEEEFDSEDNVLYRIRQPLTLQDCERLFQYASRVREFDCNMLPKIHSSVYQGLLLVLNGNKLMPNLKHLSVYHAGLDSNVVVQMFLGPRLKSINLLNDWEDSIHQGSLISVLGEHCSSLRDVQLRWTTLSEKNQQVTDIIPTAISKWNDLTSISVSILTYPAWMALSSIPKLARVHTNSWECNSRGHENRTHRQGRGFPSLEQLDIYNMYDPEDAVILLEVLSSSPMKSLNLNYWGTFTSECWKRIFRVLSEHCLHDTLQSISITAASHGIDEDIRDLGDMLEYNSFEPLLVFPNIREFYMDVLCGFYVDKLTATEHMATSWPQIRTLYFNLPHRRRNQRTSTITLDALLPFAKHCPHLESLGIFLDVTTPPDIEGSKPGNGVYQLKLSALDVGDSPASGDPTCIAAYLSSMFPVLKTIYTCSAVESEEEVETKDTWDTVQILLESFSAVRRQERGILLPTID